MNEMMRPAMGLALLIGLGMPACAAATTIAFSTDPFAGSTALTTPGRQIVGGELSTSFNVATDVFEFNPAVFGISCILFATGLGAMRRKKLATPQLRGYCHPAEEAR